MKSVRQIPPLGNPTRERFFAKFERGESNECWNWKASVSSAGYGAFGFAYQVFPAHRIAYLLEFGPIPEGMHLDHICHNRLCVNPHHLRPCTQAENNRNRKPNRKSISGHKGVQVTKYGTFLARIAGDHIGTFQTLGEAIEAYENAARARYGEFANLGGAA